MTKPLLVGLQISHHFSRLKTATHGVINKDMTKIEIFENTKNKDQDIRATERQCIKRTYQQTNYIIFIRFRIVGYKRVR